MRVLIIFRHFGCLRMFGSVISELNKNNVKVILSKSSRSSGTEDLFWYFRRTEKFETADLRPIQNVKFWLHFYVGLMVDRIRWFRADLVKYSELRDRAVPKRGAHLSIELTFKALVRFLVLCLGPKRALSLTRALLARLPICQDLKRRISVLRPDVIIVSPLVDMGSELVQHVKVAKSIGVPSVLWVHSWDNLTNKGDLKVRPNQIVVWNDEQLRELQKYHEYEAEGVVVCGSPGYERWSNSSPSRSRRAFLSRLGIASGDQFVLWLGSSSYISSSLELSVVLELSRQIEIQIPTMKIVVRPHPQNLKPWNDFRIPTNCVIFPSGVTQVPFSKQSAMDYFDSIAYAEVSVGINTSAMLESALIGTPAVSLKLSEFARGQANTIHYEHLTKLCPVFQSVGEFVEALKESNIKISELDRKSLERFVMPQTGLETPSEIMVRELQSLVRNWEQG